MALNEKQQRFVEEYLIDLNATQAAIRAGYSEKSAGQMAHELLKKHEVQEALSKSMKARQKRTEVTQDEVIQGLRELRDIAMAKKPIRITEVVKDKEGGAVPFEFDVHVLEANAAKGALELLGKHIGMFREKMEVTGPDGGPVQQVVLTAADYKAARKDMLQADDV